MSNNARDIAIRALRDRDGNVSAHLWRVLKRKSISSADRTLAAELALGVIRRRSTLDTVMKAYLSHPGKKLPSPLTEILHVALYQILFLDRIPDFAVVDEAVKQTVRFHHKRQSGLVNAVLRTALRNLSPPQTGLPTLTKDVIPVGMDAYWTSKKPVFPDPSDDPTGYLSSAFSIPILLAERWLRQTGSLAKAAGIAYQANTRAPLILRVNTLKASVEQAAGALADDGVNTVPHENGLSLVMLDHKEQQKSLIELSAFRDGMIQPQDPTATAVCMAANVKPGMNVLDFCAAPGTKTTHLAQLMGNSGSVLAADVSQKKLERIESNCQRLGISIISTILSERVGSLQPQSFDLVLADVPCSNTGVLARRAEARWRFNEPALSKLVKDQKFIAQAAATFVKPGGKLIYSTCSIEPEECSEITRWLCGQERRLNIVKETLTLPDGANDPSRWRDGGYVAVMEA